MAVEFVNLRARTAHLPSILTVTHRGRPYFGRISNAKREHYNAPLARRPQPFKHDHFHIVMPVSGEGVFEIDGKEYPATPGRVFFTSPMQRHSFFNVGNSQVRYAEINFELLPEGGPPTLELPFEDMLMAWTGQPCRYAMDLDAPPEFAHVLLTQIENLAGGGSVSRTVSDIEVSVALAQVLMAAYEHVFRIRDPGTTDPLEAARSYIHHHYREELTLDELAQQAGLEPKYFSRRFKQFFGRAPIDYQIALRIHNACELLRTADRTLEEVAEGVGINDVYYFSRIFRKRMGVSPGRYRRNLRSEEVREGSGETP
jgi:AraC-like DNA-binding protein